MWFLLFLNFFCGVPPLTKVLGEVLLGFKNEGLGLLWRDRRDEVCMQLPYKVENDID